MTRLLCIGDGRLATGPIRKQPGKHPGNIPMTSENSPGILGAIVGVIALVVAIHLRAPSGKRAGLHAPAQTTEPPTADAVAPPAAEGPVVRDVPQRLNRTSICASQARPLHIVAIVPM